MSDYYARFAQGFGAPSRGYRFMREHGHLWRYTILPVLLNLVITALVIGLLVVVALWFVRSVHPWVLAELTDWGSWVGWSASVLLGTMLFLLCLAAGILAGKLLSGILCGYFYGQLAEQAELVLGIDPQAMKSISFRYELIDTSYRLAILLVVQIIFFGVGVLPLIGGPIALLGNLSVTFMVNGMDYLDIPLALRGWRFADKRRFGMRHRMETLGLGASVFLFGLIPIVGAVLNTTAVVGAVLLHRDLQQRDAQVTAIQASGKQTIVE